MGNKVIRILLAVAIAFGLWVYVITVERTETEQTFYNVPVVLDGESVLEDRGLMLASTEELTVNLRLNGNRSDLNKLKSSDITVLVDLTRIYEPGVKHLNYTVSFPGDVQYSAIEVVSRDPDTITVTVAKWESKKIPLVAEPVGQPASGYEIDHESIQITYNDMAVDTITVSGPKDILDQIAQAKVVANMTGATESFENRVNVTLCDANGNAIQGDLSAVSPSPYNVKVTVPVLLQKTVTLDVHIKDGAGLTKDDVQYVLDRTTLTVAGRPSVIKNMKDVWYVGEIELAQVTEDETIYSFPVVLPKDLKVSATEDSSSPVKVTLTLPEETDREITVPVSDGDVVSVPPGKTATVQNSFVKIKVRGRAPVIERLTAADFEVAVDASRGTSGMCPVTVTTESEGVQIVEAGQVNVRFTLNSPTTD